MRSSVAISLVVIASVSAVCQHERRDGNWWIRQTEVAKLNYMVGFFDGMELGHEFSYWRMVEQHKGTTTCMSETNESYQSYNSKFLANVTNDQLTEGLDNFYKDYRNRRIIVFNAVWLVVNSIAGTPQNELDKMIESWRRNADN